MSDDIVQRLRDDAKFGNPAWHGWCLRLAHEAADEIERLRARLAEYEGQTQSALTPEDIGMVPERNVLVDVAGVTIKCRAVEDLWKFPGTQEGSYEALLWKFPGELEDSYDARHEDSAGDDDSGRDAGTDGRDVGDGVPVPGGVRADRVREGMPDRYPWGDLVADGDPLPFTDPRGDADTYADHHANHYIDPNADPDSYGDT